jgi:hypothetical protein
VPPVPSDVFVVNLERVVDDEPVTDEVALKVRGSTPRYLWYAVADFRTIIMAEAPPPEFVDYVRSLGIRPNIVVPSGIDLNRLSILDGLADPAVIRAVRNARVDSYVPDERLASFVHDHGGRYLSCTSNAITASAGDKSRFPHLARSSVRVPPGETVTGSAAIAALVHARLQEGKGSFVRYIRAGGGLGNRIFTVADWRHAKRGSIVIALEAGHPQLWRYATARVEDILDITHTFGVAFSGYTEISHTTLQITRGSSFYGCWLPCPYWICTPKRLYGIAVHFNRELGYLGYGGDAQVDLGSIQGQSIEYGFECNARKTGGLHIRLAAELLVGPFDTWHKRGIAVRGVDAVHLKDNLSFTQLYDVLDQAGLLDRVIIVIPPNGNPEDPTVGLAVIGIGKREAGYRAAERTYQQVLTLVGHPTRNYEDRPLFPVRQRR